jgi:putative CocE/NonD family hydrolase
MTATTNAARPLRTVRTIEHVRIPMSDGTLLAGRIWLPEDAEDAPVPAILDFLPYRYSDLLAVRDSSLYPYLAARGYAGARVDLRGSGNSDGIMTDEYTPQEQQDGMDVIAWLAAQPWCSGAVGMTGISWGGFNALQVAAHRPPALRAVISLCGTDDRYADDVHYRGGCLLAVDMLQWAVSMLTWNALPPDPVVAGEAWREIWRRRVEDTPAFIEPWLSHQRRDDYWRQGSVCEDYAAIDIPVYAVGGWADSYSDAIFRLLAGLSGPRKGLIGPWAHAYPNNSVPGPTIGYLEESLRWWDHWLKGIDTGIMDEPMLRAWMQEYVRPAAFHESSPGRWVAETSWPPPDGRTTPRQLFVHPGGWMTSGRAGGLDASPAPAPEAEEPVRHRGQQSAGLDAGAITIEGGYGDWTGDQRAEDGRSLSFTTAPLEAPLEILGHPTAHLEVSCDRPAANLMLRLCDVAPDGASLRVTFGMLNLARRLGFDRSEPLVPGRRESVTVPMKAIAHRFEAGHRIRLAVSTTYWPWLWPAPEEVEVALFSGPGGFLELPEREPNALDTELLPFGPPEHPGSMPVEILARHPSTHLLSTDLVTEESSVVFDWDVGGRSRLADGLEMDGRNITTYRIREADPLSATVVTEQSAVLRRGDFDVTVETRGEMTGTGDAFLVTMQLDAIEGNRRVLSRQWHLEFPRDGV